MSALNQSGAWDATGRDTLCVIQNASGDIIWENAIIALGAVTRGKGLLGNHIMKQATAIVFPNCSSVHCAFMSHPIDIVSLSEDGCVLNIQTVQPWGKVVRVKGTRTILEACAGTCRLHGIEEGITLSWNAKVLA